MEQLFLARFATPTDKGRYIGQASANLDLIKFFLNIAWEIKSLDHKKYAALCVPLNEIGKMVGGWKTHASKTGSHPER